MIRNFWNNERPTSTEWETETEDSYYPESESCNEIEKPRREQSTEETLEDQIKILELSKNKLKSENRKLEYKIKGVQRELAILITKNEAAENDRIELENELLISKSRIDELETNNRRLETDNRRLKVHTKEYKTEAQEKQAQLEIFEKKNRTLVKCKNHSKFE